MRILSRCALPALFFSLLGGVSPGASAEDAIPLPILSDSIAELAAMSDPSDDFGQRAVRIMQGLAAYPEADLAVHQIWQDLIRGVLRQGVPDHLPIAFQLCRELLAVPWPDDGMLATSSEWADARLRDARLGVAFLSLCRAGLIPAPDYLAAIGDPVVPEALKKQGADIAAIKREELPTIELQKVYDQTVEAYRLRDQRMARQRALLRSIHDFSGALQRFLEKRYAVGLLRFEELSEIMLMAGFDLAQRKAVFTVVMTATGKKPADFLVTGMAFDDPAGF